jgi:hypothetical protein
MNIKRLAKPMAIFGTGVIVGILGVPLLFFGLEVFQFSNTVPMSATPSTNQTGQGITVALSLNAYHGVTIHRGREQIVVSPPPKVIWSKMVVAPSANVVYLLAHDEVGHWTYNPRSLVRLSLPKNGESISSYSQTEILGRAALSNLVGDAFISELDGISTDGQRLLLRLGLKDQTSSSGYTSYFTRKAYYYYPNEGKVDEIPP